MTQETTPRPYTTLDEKVALFQEHGIDVWRYEDDDYHNAQVLVFNGDNELAQRVEDLSNQHGIPILSMDCHWWYNSKPSPEPPRWIVIFVEVSLDFRHEFLDRPTF